MTTSTRDPRLDPIAGDELANLACGVRRQVTGRHGDRVHYLAFISDEEGEGPGVPQSAPLAEWQHITSQSTVLLLKGVYPHAPSYY